MPNKKWGWTAAKQFSLRFKQPNVSACLNRERDRVTKGVFLLADGVRGGMPCRKVRIDPNQQARAQQNQQHGSGDSDTRHSAEEEECFERSFSPSPRIPEMIRKSMSPNGSV